MEDMHSDHHGPQLYLLSEESYEELKNIQGMLTLMGHIAYSEEDNTNGNAMLTIPREEIFFFFQQISAQIGDALERLSRENWLGPQSRMWQ